MIQPAVADVTWASSDLFAAAARVYDYRQRTGKVTQAADLYEQAARPAQRRTPRSTGAGQHVRGAAGALLGVRRTLPSETRQLLALLVQLQALAATVASLREAQGRAAQPLPLGAAAEHLAAREWRQAQRPSAATVVDSCPCRRESRHQARGTGRRPEVDRGGGVAWATAPS